MIAFLTAAILLNQKVPPPVYVPTPPPIVRVDVPTVHAQLSVPELPETKETMPYSIVGNWHIRVDTTIDGGCFANMVFDDYTYFRVGIAPADKKIIVMVGNRLWRSLGNNGQRAIALSFDSKEPWTASASAIQVGNIHYLAFTIEKEFLTELRSAGVVRVASSSRAVGDYDVHGFSRASNALAECQKKVELAVDPFTNR